MDLPQIRQPPVLTRPGVQISTVAQGHLVVMWLRLVRATHALTTMAAMVPTVVPARRARTSWRPAPVTPVLVSARSVQRQRTRQLCVLAALSCRTRLDCPAVRTPPTVKCQHAVQASPCATPVVARAQMAPSMTAPVTNARQRTAVLQQVSLLRPTVRLGQSVTVGLFISRHLRAAISFATAVTR